MFLLWRLWRTRVHLAFVWSQRQKCSASSCQPWYSASWTSAIFLSAHGPVACMAGAASLACFFSMRYSWFRWQETWAERLFLRSVEFNFSLPPETWSRLNWPACSNRKCWCVDFLKTVLHWGTASRKAMLFLLGPARAKALGKPPPESFAKLACIVRASQVPSPDGASCYPKVSRAKDASFQCQS